MKKYLLPLVLVFVGCHSSQVKGPDRHPSQTESLVDVLVDNPIQGLSFVEKNFQENITQGDPFCISNSAAVQEELSQVSFVNLMKSQSWFEKNIEEFMQKSFDIKHNFNVNLNKVSLSCRQKMQLTLAQLRRVEDLALELAYRPKNLDSSMIDFTKIDIPIMNPKKGFSNLVRGEKIENFKFQSGDVMITRGVSFVSATIANSTNDQTAFSHAVFVHQDAKTKKLQTIESYIGKGVSFFGIEEALRNENGRILVFRPKDKSAGQKADQTISQYIQDRARQGSPIPYDYEMDDTDFSKMTCTEIPIAAYSMSSQGQFVLPQIRSEVLIQNKDLKKAFSLPNHDVFSPVNLEMDDRFELILEWRDLELLQDQRHKDLVLKKMLSLIEKDNYYLQGTLKTLAIKLIRASRHRVPLVWNLFSKLGDLNKIPEDVPTENIVAIAKLKSVAEIIWKKVREADSHFYLKNNRPMSESELGAFIDKFVQDDQDSYIRGQYSELHIYFRPRNMAPNPNTN